MRQKYMIFVFEAFILISRVSGLKYMGNAFPTINLSHGLGAPPPGIFPSLSKRAEPTSKNSTNSTATDSSPPDLTETHFPNLPALVQPCFRNVVDQIAAASGCTQSNNSLGCLCSDPNFISPMSECFLHLGTAIVRPNSTVAKLEQCAVLYRCQLNETPANTTMANTTDLEKGCDPIPSTTTSFRWFPLCALECINFVVDSQVSKRNCNRTSSSPLATNECLCQDMDELIHSLGVCLKTRPGASCWDPNWVEKIQRNMKAACAAGVIEAELAELNHNLGCSGEERSITNATTTAPTTRLHPTGRASSNVSSAVPSSLATPAGERPINITKFAGSILSGIPREAESCIQDAVHMVLSRRPRENTTDSGLLPESKYLCMSEEFLESAIKCFNMNLRNTNRQAQEQIRKSKCSLLHRCIYQEGGLAGYPDYKIGDGCEHHPKYILRMTDVNFCGTKCLKGVIDMVTSRRNCMAPENLARESRWDCVCTDIHSFNEPIARCYLDLSPDCNLMQSTNISIFQACETGMIKSQYAQLPAWPHLSTCQSSRAWSNYWRY